VAYVVPVGSRVNIVMVVVAPTVFTTGLPENTENVTCAFTIVSRIHLNMDRVNLPYHNKEMILANNI